MLKKRIIPKLLIKSQKIGTKYRPVMVTSHNFKDYKNVGDPISQAKIFQDQLADELVIINIDEVLISENKIILDIIKKLSSKIFMPIAVGGGVRKLSDFSDLLNIGADKIIINSLAIQDPNFIKKAAEKFGSQCVVVSVDFITKDGKEFVYDNSKKKITNLGVIEWVKKISNLGCGEIILCDIDKDGEGKGLNVKICKKVSLAVNIPIIISGGCGLAEHFSEAFNKGLAEGVAAGTFFSYRDQNLLQTRHQVLNSGSLVRTLK